MCVLSIKVTIRKKSGNLSYAPRISSFRIELSILIQQTIMNDYLLKYLLIFFFFFLREKLHLFL